MSPFEVTSALQDGIPILRVTGYYEKPAGQKVAELAEGFCSEKKYEIVLDLSGCAILTSPGVSTIVELAIDLADNYSGKLIICGLDKLKDHVLTLVGIQTMAEVTPTVVEALKAAKRLQTA